MCVECQKGGEVRDYGTILLQIQIRNSHDVGKYVMHTVRTIKSMQIISQLSNIDLRNLAGRYHIADI